MVEKAAVRPGCSLLPGTLQTQFPTGPSGLEPNEQGLRNTNPDVVMGFTIPSRRRTLDC